MSATAEQRIAELERKVDLLTRALLEHTHKHVLPNEDPWNPFTNYAEGEVPVRAGPVAELQEKS